MNARHALTPGDRCPSLSIPAADLDPSGRVIVGVYSSGAIGHLMPDDVIGLIRYLSDDAPVAA